MVGSIRVWVLCLALLAAGTVSAELRIATWNLEHLAEETGSGCRERSEADYALLRRYAERLDADIVALQEVENLAAAHRVFDPKVYRIELSHRSSRRAGHCHGKQGVRLTEHRTGFAIRKGIDYKRHADLKALRVGGRHGVDVTVYDGDRPLRLLAVHLKAGCFSSRRHDRRDRDCRVLEDQFDAVERWIDTRSRAGMAAAVIGDFNRRLADSDPVWKAFSDGEPERLLLLTDGLRQTCRGSFHGQRYIDHIVLNDGAARWQRGDLRALAYEEEGEAAPSDHCPLSLDLVSPP